MLKRWRRLPLVYKVLGGNAAVIIVGAIGGTYITQSLLEVSGLGLALFFSAVGITLSLVLNYFILRRALYPVEALQRTVERIDRGDTAVRASLTDIEDPQLARFAQALNTMLGRLAAHTRMIETHRAQLRRMSARVLSAQEDERKRIARELHDQTSGSLARMLLNIEMIGETVPAESPEMREKIAGMRLLCEQTLDSVRRIIFDLRPTLLDDLGLASAIRWYAKNNLEPIGVQVQFDLANELRGASVVETALFRIAQEAITNIVRHAQAHHATIRLSQSPTHWLLSVQDDGRGFDSATALNESLADQRWGLFGVRERVELLGGTLNVESTIGKGTIIHVDIPLE